MFTYMLPDFDQENSGFSSFLRIAKWLLALPCLSVRMQQLGSHFHEIFMKLYI